MLTVYVALSFAYGLFIAHRITNTHESAWGILIGLVAKIGMPILAGYKLQVAARLNSRALRGEAMEAITCGYLSVVLIIGLAATRMFGWWWMASVAALALIPFLVKEGREAITGECDCYGNDAKPGNATLLPHPELGDNPIANFMFDPSPDVEQRSCYPCRGLPFSAPPPRPVIPGWGILIQGAT